MELKNLTLKTEAFGAAFRREKTTWKSWPENFCHLFLILYALPMNLSPLELSEGCIWMLEHLPLNWRIHFSLGLWKIFVFLNVFDAFFRKFKHSFPTLLTWKLWVENFHFGAKSQNIGYLQNYESTVCVCVCVCVLMQTFSTLHFSFSPVQIREFSINVFLIILATNMLLHKKKTWLKQTSYQMVSC